MSSISHELLPSAVPTVVVVDPRFEAYKPLAASARVGKLNLYFRSSGADAMKLARRLRVDAWLIAPDLDDMAGHDLVPLLQEFSAAAGHEAAGKLAVVESSTPGGRQWSLSADDARGVGADAVLSQPITFRDLEELLGLPSEERAKVVTPSGGTARPFVTLPVGVGAAVIAIAVLMMG